jgi:predicted dehydrogenase
MINLGVIGYGGRSQSLISVCATFNEIKLAAIADTSEAARQAIATHFPDVPVFDNHLAMLDSGKVNAVLVESPPSTHAACSCDALARGIHVLSDVPAVYEIEEAKQLWEAGQASKAIFAFGATTNYWGYVQTCLDLINNDLLGKPYYCEAEYVSDIRDLAEITRWRKHFASIRYCTHSLGPVLKWVGEELVAVSCFDTGGHISGDPEDHDAMVAIFRTKSNVVVKVLTSFVTNHPIHFHRYTCHGTKGYFEESYPAEGHGSQVLFSTREIYGMNGLIRLPVSEGRPEIAAPAEVGGHGGADYLMIKDFVETITTGKRPGVDMREALMMTLPGTYAIKSAAAGGALTTIHYPWTE